jgi:RNA polymerase sigma-70 factor, ECF subfamily
MDPPLTALGDSALIKLVLSGRTECFAVLMNRYLPTMQRRIGSIVTNTADVEDLSQEVFFKIWHHLSTFREESAFGTWVTRIAINEALNLCQRNHRPPNWQTVDDLDTFASAIDSPLQCLARTEARQMLHYAVAKLPVIYGQVLILREIGQFSMEEIARFVRTTVPTVKTRLFRARGMLLRQIPRAKMSGVSSEASECIRRDRRGEPARSIGPPLEPRDRSNCPVEG